MVEIVAKTIYGEARDFGVLDRLAVGLLSARVLRPGWWGSTWEEVCMQFGCWSCEAETEFLAGLFRGPQKVSRMLVYRRVYREPLYRCGCKELFGEGSPIPTHYHLMGQEYPKEWGEPGVVINPLWKSRFKFYAGISGTPMRK